MNLPWARREDLPAVLKQLGLADASERGAEVGVQRGHFAAQILNAWPGNLFLVDPWRHLEGYDDAANVSDAEQELIYREAVHNAHTYGPGRFLPLRTTSLEAAAALKTNNQGELAFVYLDADHSYEAVKVDLEAWYPLVKSGGVIAGHDWVPDGKHPEGNFGVRKAVREFFAMETIDIHITAKDGPWFSWLVVKP
jgi:hypothetical protein